MNYFINHVRVTREQAFAIIQQLSKYLPDDRDALVLWAQAHVTQSARKNLQEFTGYSLVLIP